MRDNRSQADVSIVLTVLNEAGTIGDLFRSIAAQTVRPREVIVVDGGSRDGTQARIEWWHGRLGCPLRVIEADGANISAGRNRGIAAARTPVVAVTDGGVILDPVWLATLAAPFADPTVDVVSGFFVSDARTTFEIALGAATLPDRAEIVPERFLPSSRSVAFRVAVWANAGGYPEWLDYCEDLVFDFALRDSGCRFVFAPDAVAHFRPRRSFGAFWHQYFRYARGDGKADLWRTRHLVRYGTYAAALALVTMGRRGKPIWLPALLAALGYFRRPFLRLWRKLPALSPGQRIVAVALVPLLRAWGDAAKMAGYPVGVMWRWRHAAPHETK